MRLSAWRALLLLLSFILMTSTARGETSERRLPLGVGTLSKGTNAISLDLGVDLPEPIFYGLRYDLGVTKHIQLGVGGAIFGFANTFAINSTFNLYRSHDERNFLSAMLTPFFIHASDALFGENGDTSDAFLFFLTPALGYEHRFGSDRKTGLFLKIGTAHLLGTSAEGEFLTLGLQEGLIALSFRPGLHHQFGHRFSITLEPSVYLNIQDTSNRFDILGKIGFSWAW